jgi:hypothetical protein
VTHAHTHFHTEKDDVVAVKLFLSMIAAITVLCCCCCCSLHPLPPPSSTPLRFLLALPTRGVCPTCGRLHVQREDQRNELSWTFVSHRGHRGATELKKRVHINPLSHRLRDAPAATGVCAGAVLITVLRD